MVASSGRRNLSAKKHFNQHLLEDWKALRMRPPRWLLLIEHGQVGAAGVIVKMVKWRVSIVGVAATWNDLSAFGHGPSDLLPHTSSPCRR